MRCRHLLVAGVLWPMLSSLVSQMVRNSKWDMVLMLLLRAMSRPQFCRHCHRQQRPQGSAEISTATEYSLGTWESLKGFILSDYYTPCNTRVGQVYYWPT